MIPHKLSHHDNKCSEALGSESDTTENNFNACFYSRLVMARNADVVTLEPHPYVQNVGSTHRSAIELFTALKNGSCLLIVAVMVVLEASTSHSSSVLRAVMVYSHTKLEVY